MILILRGREVIHSQQFEPKQLLDRKGLNDIKYKLKLNLNVNRFHKKEFSQKMLIYFCSEKRKLIQKFILDVNCYPLLLTMSLQVLRFSPRIS